MKLKQEKVVKNSRKEERREKKRVGVRKEIIKIIVVE